MSRIVHVKKRFEYTGKTQTWMVPAGVYRIRITASGAGGGPGGATSGDGGYTGGSSTCGFAAQLAQRDIPVKAGDRLFIDIGTGGYPGSSNGNLEGWATGGAGGTGIKGGTTNGGSAESKHYGADPYYSGVPAGGGGGGAATEIRFNGYRDISTITRELIIHYVMSASGGRGGDGNPMVNWQNRVGTAGAPGGYGLAGETWWPFTPTYDTSVQTQDGAGALGGLMKQTDAFTPDRQAKQGSAGWVEVEYDQDVNETIIQLEGINQEYISDWFVGETNHVIYAYKQFWPDADPNSFQGTRAQVGGRFVFVPRLRINDAREVNYNVELKLKSNTEPQVEVPGVLSTNYPKEILSNYFTTASWDFDEMSGVMNMYGSADHINGMFETLQFVQNINWLALDEGGFTVAITVQDEIGRTMEGQWVVYSNYGTYDRYNNETWILTRTKPTNVHEFTRFSNPSHPYGSQLVNNKQKALLHRTDSNVFNDNATFQTSMLVNAKTLDYKSFLTGRHDDLIVYGGLNNPNAIHGAAIAHNYKYYQIPSRLRVLAPKAATRNETNYQIDRFLVHALLRGSTKGPIDNIDAYNVTNDRILSPIPLFEQTTACTYVSMLPEAGPAWFKIGDHYRNRNLWNVKMIPYAGKQFSQHKMEDTFKYDHVRHTMVGGAFGAKTFLQMPVRTVSVPKNSAIQYQLLQNTKSITQQMFLKFELACWRTDLYRTQYDYYMEFSRFDGDRYYERYDEDLSNNWTYDPIKDQVFSTANSNYTIGLVSAIKSKHYEVSAYIGSEDSDDDWVGLVVAFARDENTGTNRSLVAWRNTGNNGSMLRWVLSLVVNRTVTHIWNGSGTLNDNTSGGWAKYKGCWMEVKRDKNNIRIMTGQMNTDTLDENTTYAVDLTTLVSTYPDIAYLLNNTSYGFAANSQARAFYKNVWVNNFDSFNNIGNKIQPRALAFYNYRQHPGIILRPSAIETYVRTMLKADSKPYLPIHTFDMGMKSRTVRWNVDYTRNLHKTINVRFAASELRIDLANKFTKPASKYSDIIGQPTHFASYHLLSLPARTGTGFSLVFDNVRTKPIFGDEWGAFQVTTSRMGRVYTPDLDQMYPQGSGVTPDGGRPPYGRISGGISYVVHPGYLRGYVDFNNPNYERDQTQFDRNDPRLETTTFGFKSAGRLNG